MNYDPLDRIAHKTASHCCASIASHEISNALCVNVIKVNVV